MANPLDSSSNWRKEAISFLSKNPRFYLFSKWETLYSSHPALLHVLRGLTIRFRTLKHLIETLAKKQKYLEPSVFAALLLGYYQILFMPEIPDYAAINETVEGVKAFSSKGAGFVNALLRKLIKEVEICEAMDFTPSPNLLPLEKNRWARFSSPLFPHPQKQLEEYLSLAYSFPIKMVRQFLSLYGLEKTQKILQESNERPPLFARIRKGYEKPGLLESWQNEISSIFPEARIYPTFQQDFIRIEGIQLTQWPPFQRGEVYIQDFNSGRMVSQLLQASSLSHPPSRIIDLCAAPGGKLFHLYDLFPDAEILGMDKDAKGILKIQENCQRLGIDRIRILQKDCLSLNPKEWGFFDLILLDAPCSNTGVMRRKVQARWLWEKKRKKNLPLLQKEMILKNLPLLSPKGLLLYMTCSILDEENRTHWKEMESQGLVKIKELRLLPGDEGGDGFWGALFQKEK